MARYNEGYCDNKCREEQLPMPQVALKEESDKGKNGCCDATDRFGKEVQDDSGKKTAHAAEQTHVGKEKLLEDSCKTHCKSAQTRGETDEYPHHQYVILVMCAMMGTIVIFYQKVYHQRSTYQRYAKPKPCTPVLMP